jgi:hypothetical protein
VNHNKKYILVFDVESTSLHGKAFAVGAIVIEASTGREVDQLLLKSKESEKEASDWVKENVLPYLGNIPTAETDRELRDKFWEFYKKHQKDSYIWADVAYPVETNFLEQVYRDNPGQREFEMPYPIHDVANHLDVNIDRADFSELAGAIKHDPYWDAKASAFSLLRVRGSMMEDMGKKSDFWEKVKVSSWERFKEKVF